MKRRHALLLMAMVLVALAGCGGNSWSSGDRVIVAKFLYDSHLEKPARYEVVVFKYPEAPLKNQVPTNYIKRLLGLPGELLAILFGRLYVCNDDAGKDLRQQLDDRGRISNDLDLWKSTHMHREDPRPRELFREGKFQILRKPPETMLAMRRIVYDNDHQARDLQGVLPPRWALAGGWEADTPTGFRHGGAAAAEMAWLRYQHILRPVRGAITQDDKKPQLIRDVSGYNSYELRGQTHTLPASNWVGDLMLDFELTVDRAEGELWLELARGVDRFQACWKLQSGECTLFRIDNDTRRQPQKLGAAQTRVSRPGTYHLRFANFDDQLTLWVDRDLPFGDGVTYDPAKQPGPTANDLQPALIGSKGAAVKVHHLKLWRDTYYTAGARENVSAPDANLDGLANRSDPLFWSDPDKWQPLREPELTTLFVQPGHYLCLGDNSPESSDGRTWGTVPQRLMLGRALAVYWPANRFGSIK